MTCHNKNDTKAFSLPLPSSPPSHLSGGPTVALWAQMHTHILCSLVTLTLPQTLLVCSLSLEQSSWVVGGYEKDIALLPKFCFLQARFMDTWQRLSDWSWLAIHNRYLGTHFITCLLTACLSALLQMSASIRWHQWLCIFCDSRPKVCLRHQKHFRACRPGARGLFFLDYIPVAWLSVPT